MGATRGLLGTLLRLLREDDVTHVGVAFDHVIESFRNELFGGYKTGAGIDPDLWSQAPLAERAARALGLVVWPMVPFEADDAMAAAAARYGALVPASMQLLGDLNWYLPRWLDWLPHIAAEGEPAAARRADAIAGD